MTLLKCCTLSQATLSPVLATTSPELLTTSLARVTSGPPCMRARTAFMEKARNWPKTIIIWSTATRVPRMRLGAVSPRKTGTIAEAPPTAKPSTIRKK